MENKELKRKLIIQSFLPLTVLIIIKNSSFDIWKSLIFFLKRLIVGKMPALLDLYRHPYTWSFLLILICILFTISGCIAVWQFNMVQFSGFTDAGEKVKIEGEITDSGIIFFMTFILPLIVDDVRTFNDFSVYLGIIFMIIILMTKTNLYYQNPVLTLLGYKIYKIKFINPSIQKCANKQFVAVCKNVLNEDKIVKWKYISDDVCLMYNKN